VDGHFAAVVPGRVRGVGRHTDPAQIHLFPVGGCGGLSIGIAGHGNLVDQALIAGHEIDQGERFIGLGLLLVQRNFTFLLRLRLSIPSRGRVGIFDDLAFQMKQG